MLDTTSRVAMITGANRGIGNALARQLHHDGWTVSLGARNLDQLLETTADLGEERVSHHRYDANNRATDGAWIESTMALHGRIDGLINNAGVAHLNDLESLDDDALDDMFAVNVKAPLRLIQQCLPQLRTSGTGRIVNLVSMSGKRVSGTFAPGYAMSKFAALALSHATRQAVWDQGIRVTAVCPGFVATDMTDEFGPDKATQIQPADLAETVATIMRLPNTAQVAELLVTCVPEAMA